MKILLIWLCTTAAFDDCQVHALSHPVPPAQCEAMKTVHYEVLGPADNYRLSCEDAQL